MIYGYARVSTRLQQVKGFSLDEQKETLLNAGCEQIYEDTYTGKTSARPQFSLLCDVLGQGDILVCTKLDRLCRSVLEGLQLIESLLAKGVTINILNLGVLDKDNPTSKFLLQSLLAVAELERSMIVERTREGKAIAKTRPGYREGRPKTDPAKIDAAFTLLDTGDRTVKDVCAAVGISRSTLMRYKKERKGQ